MYIANSQGDIVAIQQGSEREPFDPSSFGWLNRGGKNDPGDERRSLDALRAVPNMTVSVAELPALTPGPKLVRSRSWTEADVYPWVEGHAPPAVLMSRGGWAGPGARKEKTSARFDRLTEALGQIGRNLPSAPDRSPMVVYDFVNGQRIEVAYTRPPRSPNSAGTVYLLDDGAGIKIGWTSGDVPVRVASLQTGNSSVIVQVAEIHDAGLEIESHLHAVAAEWHMSGEWFQRGRIVAEAAAAGGFKKWLLRVLPDGRWTIETHPPYT